MTTGQHFITPRRVNEIKSNKPDRSCEQVIKKKKFSVSAAAALNLKYLLEPPVYAEVTGRRGQNITLPCVLRAKPSQYRVKWSKLEPERVGPENVILVSNEQGCKPYGPLGRRASLRRAHMMDASLQLSHLQLQDDGMYRCQLVHGIEDESVVVSLWVEGQRSTR